MVKEITVEFLQNGEVINTKEYRSLLQFTKEFPQLKHHQVREVYDYCTGRNKRSMHPFNLQLLQMIRISDKQVNLNDIFKLNSPVEDTL